MANPTTFTSVCQTQLQNMIELVPAGVTLTANTIAPYEIKPSQLQLTLLSGGCNLQFSGQIRVRTTVRPASQILSVALVYVDRNGGNTCGSCSITTTDLGSAAGIDDNFEVSILR
jgi:hypothetical protein